MDESVYRFHYEQEERHWWFAARAAIVRRILERYGNISPGETILDIGCGTGAFLKSLSDTYRVVGIDLSPLAVQFSRKRGLTEVFEMPIEEFPRDRYQIRTALLLDVIEHIDDDLSVLRDASEIVGEEGRVIITVPAHMWMWSAHDLLHHHKRRYSAASLRAVLDRAGLEPVKFTHYNSLLFPAAALIRLLDRRRDPSIASTRLDIPPPLMNGLLRRIFATERHVVPGMNLPFGVSLLAVARQKRAGSR